MPRQLPHPLHDVRVRSPQCRPLQIAHHKLLRRPFQYGQRRKVAMFQRAVPWTCGLTKADESARRQSPDRKGVSHDRRSVAKCNEDAVVHVESVAYGASSTEGYPGVRILQQREPIEIRGRRCYPLPCAPRPPKPWRRRELQLRSVPPMSTYPKTDSRPAQTSSPSRFSRSRSQLPYA